MDELIIQSDKETKLVLHSKRLNSDGWLDSYFVAIQARNFQAEIEVSNQPYGTSPDEFFETLAANWRGWEGEKSWGAIEGEYSLVATADSVGHITLIATLASDPFPPSWSGSISLILEAGQLEQLFCDAKRFFHESA